MERLRYSRPFYVKWYKTAAWKRMRARVLKRYPLCQMCKEYGVITPSAVADHKTPHKGNMELFFCMENIWGICKECHSGAKQRMEKSGEFGCDTNGIVEGWK